MVVSDLVGNSKDRFSCNVAHILGFYSHILACALESNETFLLTLYVVSDSLAQKEKSEKTPGKQTSFAIPR